MLEIFVTHEGVAYNDMSLYRSVKKFIYCILNDIL